LPSTNWFQEIFYERSEGRSKRKSNLFQKNCKKNSEETLHFPHLKVKEMNNT
jgi:hypothetical protein